MEQLNLRHYVQFNKYMKIYFILLNAKFAFITEKSFELADEFNITINNKKINSDRSRFFKA